jgi:hypothetical protein
MVDRPRVPVAERDLGGTVVIIIELEIFLSIMT